MTANRTDEHLSAIEAALDPGRFIDWRSSHDFRDDLDAVHRRILDVLEGGDPVLAAELLEALAAGCQAKADEVDDSDAMFSSFARDVLASWIRARQAADADSAETAVRLVEWMEADRYGHVNDLEGWAVGALDGPGREALEIAVRVRAEESGTSEWFRRQAIAIRKAVLARRRDVDGFLALCDAADGLTPRDCEVLADMCARRPEAALAWVERGIELQEAGTWRGMARTSLARRQRDLLARLGRPEEALALAWEAFLRRHDPHAYEELMRWVPRDDRPVWHAKALGALDDAPISNRIEVLVATREAARLAGFVLELDRDALMAPGHHVTEPAAELLEPTSPLASARLRLALGLRIVEAKKSRYYAEALRHLERGRDLLVGQGRQEEWEETVREVRERHGAKYSFMPGFEILAEGGSTERPSFLERARARWSPGGALPTA